MKAAIGFGFFLLFLAGLALVMLQGQEMARQNLPGGGAAITGKNWRPVTIEDAVIPDENPMFIHFAADGSINGNGGCNKFFGTLTTTDDGITMGEIGSTRMACPAEIMDRETEFLQALQSTRQFELAGGSLRLLDSAGDVLMQLVTAD